MSEPETSRSRTRLGRVLLAAGVLSGVATAGLYFNIHRPQGEITNEPDGSVNVRYHDDNRGIIETTIAGVATMALIAKGLEDLNVIS